jgi:predicted RNase H-like HicB family nuclease
MNTYKVDAFWDETANVWVATSEDVAGLATEAETIELLTAKLRVMITELLTLNEVINTNQNTEIKWELITHRQELITIAS